MSEEELEEIWDSLSETDVHLLPFEYYNHTYTILKFCEFDHFEEDWKNEFEDVLEGALTKIIEKAIQNKQFVPEDFKSYLNKEGHYLGKTTDAQGDPLIYVFTKDLLELEELHKEYYKKYDEYIKEEEDEEYGVYTIEKEQALGTMAYIKTLPKNRKIALCRH